ncbi:MAG: S9 family peptidase [Oceanicaulis sp.]|nr:S9 family peptidase [Oceanicaulis sp.]
MPNHLTALAASVAVSAGIVCAGAASAAQPVEIDAFARVPNIQSISMSADGQSLAAIVAAPGSNNTDTALATWDLSDPGAAPVVTPSGDRMKFIQAAALKGEHVLVFGRQEWTGRLGGCGEGRVTGATSTFVFRPYLTDVAQSSFSEAFANNTRRIGISAEMQRCFEIAGTASLVNTLPLDPENVIISQLNQVSLSSNYYRYNLRTGDTELIVRGSGRSTPGLFNPRTGELMTRSRIDSDGSDEYIQQILFRNPETGQFEIHDNLTRRLSERYTVSIAGIDEESGQFYVLTDLFSDRVEAWMYDPVAREFSSEPLIAHPEYSIGGIILGSRPSNFNRLLGFTIAGPGTEVVYIDPDMISIHEGLSAAFPDQRVSIQSYNDDLSIVLFSTGSNRHAPSFHILRDRQRVETLGSSRPWISPEQIGEQRWVTYPARDGLEIPAILDLPPGWTPEQGPLPTIINPHGGPWVRDSMGWDGSGWVQFLTSRGYAVLRPNYRGSAGLGRELWLAGDNEWGQAMQDDKDDGAAWLVEQGIADPDRLAIFGYSYGGFAAAAAVVRPDSPYQCAISGAPVTDLARLGNTWSENRLQRILQGQTVSGMDPMRHTDRANIPVLLYVGDRDVRTPAFHARNFYNRVRDRVPAQLHIIRDMPHQMPWYPRHHTETLGLIENFLANECGM